jgi:hypothetical protein
VITFVAPYAVVHPALVATPDLTPNPAATIAVQQGLETTLAGTCTASPGSSTVVCVQDQTSFVVVGQYFSINGFTSKVVSRAFTTSFSVVLVDQYNLGAFTGVAKAGRGAFSLRGLRVTVCVFVCVCALGIAAMSGHHLYPVVLSTTGVNVRAVAPAGYGMIEQPVAAVTGVTGSSALASQQFLIRNLVPGTPYYLTVSGMNERG